MSAKRRKGESYAAFIRRKRRNTAARCHCLGWWFPHRIGSKSTPIDSGPDKGERIGCFNGA